MCRIHEFMHYPHGHPLHWPRPPSLRKKTTGQYLKTLFTERIDRRRWRGELRRWLKHPSDSWWPPEKRRVRNDLTTSRILKQTYAIVLQRRG